MKSAKPKTKRWLYFATVLFAIVIVAMLSNLSAISTASKWLAHSQRYKAELLAQPVPRIGELRHVEWDVWGWAGQDTTVYLVFDPTNSLSAAAISHSSGKFKGIPCEIFRVNRLEKDWYTVQFYTNEFWGRTNELNCTGVGT